MDGTSIDSLEQGPSAGPKNTEFYAFLDVWEPIKVAGTTPNEAFSPNQRTLGTPKQLQMSQHVVPPHAL